MVLPVVPVPILQASDRLFYGCIVYRLSQHSARRPHLPDSVAGRGPWIADWGGTALRIKGIDKYRAGTMPYCLTAVYTKDDALSEPAIAPGYR